MSLPRVLQSKPASLVCNTCDTTLFSPSAFDAAWSARDDSGSDGFSYKCKWKDVHDNAADGCSWCRVLAAGLPIALEYKTRSTEDVAEETFQVSVAFQRRHTQSLCLRLCIDHFVQPYEIHSDPDDIAAKYITEREVIYQLGTEKCFKDAAKAVRACAILESGHEDCKPPVKNVLPTRVVDCLDPAKPRLHITEPGFRDYYATLSYVWGEDQPHKTTTANISLYKQAIDHSLLPQTIRDALICTKELGLRYLWVDALCIVQDSTDDKRREISRMRNIFRDAFVTIVAGSASSVSEGFLQDRPPPPPAVRLPFICPGVDGLAGSMLIREPRVESLSKDPVNSRAWCLEERLLTQRALIYSSSTLQFSCISTRPHAPGTSSNAFYADDVRLPPFMFYSEEESHQKLSLDKLTLDLSLDVVRELRLQSIWSEVVAEYTRRDLTRQKDRLVAIGGVAEEFKRFWRLSEYFAGLWGHNLLDDLLWEKSEKVKSTRPEKYRAPSWSWAAINGQALLMPLRKNVGPIKYFYLCEVIKCETTLADTRYPYGEVIGGVLELRAMVNKVLWSPTTSTLFFAALGDHKNLLTRHASPDCEEEVTRTEREVWAIPIRRCLGGGANSIEGILVVPVMEPKGAYRRVGSFAIGVGKPPPNFDIGSWLYRDKVVVSIV